jgi:hypothetical protein
MSVDLLCRLPHALARLCEMGAAAERRAPSRLLSGLIEAQAAVYAQEDSSRQIAGPASLALRPHRWLGREWQVPEPGPLRHASCSIVALSGALFEIVVGDAAAAVIQLASAELGETVTDHVSRIAAHALEAYGEALAAEGPEVEPEALAVALPAARPSPRRVLRRWRAALILPVMPPLVPIDLGDPAPGRSALDALRAREGVR